MQDYIGEAIDTRSLVYSSYDIFRHLILVQEQDPPFQNLIVVEAGDTLAAGVRGCKSSLRDVEVAEGRQQH